jgi:hypothetical protein
MSTTTAAAATAALEIWELVLVGMLWGCTNPFMNKNSKEKENVDNEKSSEQQSSQQSNNSATKEDTTSAKTNDPHTIPTTNVTSPPSPFHASNSTTQTSNTKANDASTSIKQQAEETASKQDISTSNHNIISTVLLKTWNLICNWRVSRETIKH